MTVWLVGVDGTEKERELHEVQRSLRTNSDLREAVMIRGQYVLCVDRNIARRLALRLLKRQIEDAERWLPGAIAKADEMQLRWEIVDG